MSTLVAGDIRTLHFDINTTDLAANNAEYIYCPFDGYLVEMDTCVQAAVTTGGTIQVQTATAANLSDIKNVTGMAVTIANAAAAGTRQKATPSASATKTNIQVSKGDLIKLVLTGFATAGAINGVLQFNTSIDKRKASGY